MNAEALDLMLQRELRAASRGDRDAYGRIVGVCQNTVTAIALAITRDVASSEDIAQDAFIKAWQQLDRLKNHASFLPWLRQITRNLARDHLRAQRGRPLDGERAELVLNLAADSSPSPAEHLELTEEERAAQEVISALPEDSRETLLLFYREGQSSQQVATLLGLSDAAVRKRLSRARASVREEMLKRFGDFARGSAPSAAFALVVVGGLVGAMPAASAATVIGSGVLGHSMLGGGLSKLGGMAGGGTAGGVAGGSIGAIYQHVTQHPGALAGAISGMLAGTLAYVLTWWYLSSFCSNADERRQVRSFLWLNAVTGAVWMFSLMLSVVLTDSKTVVLAIFALGMAILNYQYLVTLERIMQPLLAREANAGRRRTYAYLMGKPAIVMSSLVALAAILWAIA